MKILNKQKKLRAIYVLEEKYSIVSNLYKTINFLPYTFEKFLRYQIIGYKNRNRNTCISTSNSNAIISKFSISRQVFREKALIGLLSGISKY